MLHGIKESQGKTINNIKYTNIQVVVVVVV